MPLWATTGQRIAFSVPDDRRKLVAEIRFVYDVDGRPAVHTSIGRNAWLDDCEPLAGTGGKQ